MTQQLGFGQPSRRVKGRFGEFNFKLPSEFKQPRIITTACQLSNAFTEATQNFLECKVIVLLLGEPLAQLEVLSALNQVFIIISLYFAPSDQFPGPFHWKTPTSMMLPPPCFTIGVVLGRWWAVPAYSRHLELRPNGSILVSSDERILFLTLWESFRRFFANSQQAFMCLSLRRGFSQAIVP